MNEINSLLDSLISSGKLDEAEELLFNTTDKLADDAAGKCDNGDYPGALEIYRRIIELMQRYYGDSIDLSKIETDIKQIQELV